MDGKKPTRSSDGYFTSVFPPPASAGQAKGSNGAVYSDLYSMLNKQNADGQNSAGHSNSSIPGHGAKPHGSPTKAPGASYKDGKQHYASESAESPYFGSSVHYGGRDFYGSAPKHEGASSKTNKVDNHDDSVATRGDWWQGSLYY